MTFREFMKENGNEVKTTFWEDFSIAERFQRVEKKITNF